MIFQHMDWQIFAVKGRIHILSVVDNLVSVTTTHLCLCSRKAATDNRQMMCLCFNKTLLPGADRGQHLVHRQDLAHLIQQMVQCLSSEIIQVTLRVCTKTIFAREDNDNFCRKPGNVVRYTSLLVISRNGNMFIFTLKGGKLLHLKLSHIYFEVHKKGLYQNKKVN